jgi:predicted butyrate kinase (DUF1464 family)
MTSQNQKRNNENKMFILPEIGTSYADVMTFLTQHSVDILNGDAATTLRFIQDGFTILALAFEEGTFRDKLDQTGLFTGFLNGCVTDAETIYIAVK